MKLVVVNLNDSDEIVWQTYPRVNGDVRAVQRDKLGRHAQDFPNGHEAVKWIMANAEYAVTCMNYRYQA